MNIKAVIFDLDGVLWDSRVTHFKSLNKAISEIAPGFEISDRDQATIFEGLPTSEKLALLTKNRGLPNELHQAIWERKQTLTQMEIGLIKPSERLHELFVNLSKSDLLIGVATNARRATATEALKRLGLYCLVTHIQAGDEVANPKPHPEIYWVTMSRLGVLPSETIVVEDSALGREAATHSGAIIAAVNGPEDVTEQLIMEKINMAGKKRIPWVDKNLNVVIPMAGLGKRFADAGYSFPKPLIDVNGKPMIQRVVDSLNFEEARFIFVANSSHAEKYHLAALLDQVAPGHELLLVDNLTRGAAETVLVAEELIDSSAPLVIANSDQLIDWDANQIMFGWQSTRVDAGVLVFESTHPKWSFVRLDQSDNVVEVAEKKPISNIATVGVYYFRHGSSFVHAAKEMIRTNQTVNGEFYVAPTLNELVKQGKRVVTAPVEKMWGLGTPEDLDTYFRSHSVEADSL